MIPKKGAGVEVSAPSIGEPFKGTGDYFNSLNSISG